MRCVTVRRTGSTTSRHRHSPLTDSAATTQSQLEGREASTVVSGHTALGLGVVRDVNWVVDLTFRVDNRTNRPYWEKQTYFQARDTPDGLDLAGLYATPGYPLTAVAGETLR